MERIGIVMHGVTGRMGYNQHLVRSILRDPRPGRRHARERRPAVRSIRSSSAATPTRCRRWPSSTASRAGPTDLDAALANPDDTIFFDAGTTQMRAGLLSRAHRRRQARLLRKADLGRPRRRARRSRRRPGPRASSTASVQDKLFLPGLKKLAMLHDSPASSAACSRCAASSATGCSRATGAAGAAPVLELPQGRRRRHHPRHALPLALRARQPVRRGQGGVLPRRHAHSRRASTRRASPTPPTPTTPPMPPSSSRAA